MDKDTKAYVVEKTKQLIDAPACSKETKLAAQAWLDAADTGREQEETRKYIAELEADIMPIDNLIAFASSENGASYFGEEKAKEVAAHAAAIKSAGAQYCDCPACTIVAEILAKKEQL